ncbi:MAG TPA: hypothetical protein VLE51_00630 [Candidatus Saccharimonadales bacterium]|nr:hypothetical protein [Candidatus Saccharimonadales bacterium]
MNPTTNKPSQPPTTQPNSKPAVQSTKILDITPKKLRFVLLSLLGLVIIIFLATASLGLGILSNKSKQLVDVKLQSRTVDAQLTSLELAKKQVDKYAYFDSVAKTVLPTDKDQAQAVLDIQQQANQSGIAIGSITFPASNLGATSSTTLATGSGSTSAAISQAKPVQGISGLYSLELTISPQTGPGVPASQTVTYPKLLDFLNRIEKDRRTAQITEVHIEPQADQTLTVSLGINIFIRPAK